MERKYYKAINFDLDTVKLREFYPRYQQAYKDLLIFFKKNNFSHRQGSGYLSNEKLSSADIVDLIGELQKVFSWADTWKCAAYCYRKKQERVIRSNKD